MPRERSRRLPHSGLIVAVALAGGCHGTATVEVDVGPDAASGDYVVVVAREDGAISTVACPGGDADGLTCTDAGAAITEARGSIEVTVKARGMDFRSTEVKVRDLPREGDVRRLDLALAALPAFEVTDDYATGFGAEDGGLFDAMSVSADTELGRARLVKFYLEDVQGDPKVYFQNTPLHPLHYDFAREVLGVTGTNTDFWLDTYQGTDRTAMAGTLVVYDDVVAASASVGGDVQAPVAITFFPADDLTPAQARLAHELLEERLGFAPLVGGDPNRVVYLPAGSDQEDQLAAERDLFDHRGSAWMLHHELWGNTTLQFLNDGEAYGTLRRMTPTELAATVVSYTDVLLLTTLPNDLPIVGGTITEEFQTPLAHVNLAARARGTPNLAWLDAAADPNVQSLLGHLVHFKVADDDFVLEAATVEQAEAFWASRTVVPVALTADLTADGLYDFAELGFADSTRVGTKAANLAELHSVLGDGSPDGFAVPFAWYDRTLRESLMSAPACGLARTACVTDGRAQAVCDDAADICLAYADPESLRGYSDRLLDDDRFKSDSTLREALLAGLRELIRGCTLPADLATALDARVTTKFGASASVRMRSSTNAEDLENFSGAGLYDSYTATDAVDDLPHLEIRKVWASVWNWAAFEERSWWGIDQRSVYMGVAVHRSFGDEAANGVLITQNIADPSVAGMYVNVQLGEALVTNPEAGALPEIFSVVPSTSPGQVQVVRLSYSSLSPSAPILSEVEIKTLYDAAVLTQNHFAPLYGESPESMALDLEFKVSPGDRAVTIKQVRPFAG